MAWGGWNNEAVETMKAMTAEGCSATQIARALGCTRNAVCGKRDRMGIASLIEPWVPGSGLPPSRPYRNPLKTSLKPKRPKNIKRPRTNIVSGFIATTQPKPPSDHTLREDQPLACEPVNLLDLKPHCCKWPITGCRLLHSSRQTGLQPRCFSPSPS